MPTRTNASDHSLVREYEGLSLGDKRLARRALEIAEAAARSPADSFPEQMFSTAGREALYRFFSNPKVTLPGLLEAHIRATHERMVGHDVVRIAHDTTSMTFSGEREGLGFTTGGPHPGHGFKTHLSLAIGGDETREPLGVLAANVFVRLKAGDPTRTKTERNRASLEKPRGKRESSRWGRQAIEVDRALPANGARAIHVMDQEADDYALFGELHAAGVAFVIRGSPERKTALREMVKDVLATQPSQFFRQLDLDARPGNKRRPARAERTTELHVRWGRVVLRRPYGVESKLNEVELNAVHVIEPRPPSGQEPIEWLLFTSEPVRSLADAEAIVDHYRARWMIEEYFKALKTGCAIEKRQLMTLDALTRALGLFIPIAWRLLALRHVSRAAPDRSAASLMDREQLLLLSALLEKRRRQLPQRPSVRDVMLGVAALGGHIPNNGDPGWQVLGRGFVRFAEAEEVWRLARKCDQS
jgi:hypothetical protein